MKTKVKLYALLSAVALLASCDHTDTDLNSTLNSDVRFEISIEDAELFDARPRVQTAATPDTAGKLVSQFQIGDELGLFAVRHAPGSTGMLQPSNNYWHNVKLSARSNGAGGGSWVPDGSLFYPPGGDVLDIYAYYPYYASFNNPTDIRFLVEQNQSTSADYSKSDLLLAQIANKANDGTPISFVFSHAMAMVQVQLLDPSGILNIPNGVTLSARLGTNYPASPLPKRAATVNWATMGLGTADTQSDIKMFPVGNFTYRALLPAQELATATRLVFAKSDVTEEASFATTANITLVQGKYTKFEITVDATSPDFGGGLEDITPINP
ncbi:hypothetical protein AGMMS4957_06170 [Bacteroidia bacterium]|nr:hypothetical protein AGMMS4957_06170 [Bacteroidia bacterium]